MSMIDPLTCLFGKTAIYQISSDSNRVTKFPKENVRSHQSRVLKIKYEKYLKYFEDEKENFHVDYEQFKHCMTTITKYMNELNKRKLKLKNSIIKQFSSEEWKKLGQKRQKHTLSDCKGCLKEKLYRDYMTQLPVKNKQFKIKATEAGIYKKQELASITNNIVETLNNQFQSEYRTSFITQAKKHVPDFEDTKCKEKRAIAKEIIKDCQNQYAETSVTR